MKVFDKIEKILKEKRLGVNDFLDLTGFPKTSYYSLKSGKTESITHKVAYRISDAFPEYTVDWLLESPSEVLKSTKKLSNSELNYNGVDIPLKWIADTCAANYDDALKESDFLALRVKDSVQEKTEKILNDNGIKLIYKEV